MSRSAEIRWEFGGEERLFRMTLEVVQALQESKCDAGPSHIWDRLNNGAWKDHDVFEPILRGLIGAKMPSNDALKLVRRHIQPLGDHVELAKALCAVAVTGVPDEAPKELGETATRRPSSSRSPAEKFDSPGSGDGAAQWG